jgi:peptide/nickel transport system substrate-binding protein
MGYVGITFNTGNGPAANSVINQNKMVRQAFELAIDRDALAQVVFNGMNAPTAQANARNSPYYDASIQPPARDVAKAKALLAQAGVKIPVPVTLTITNETDTQQAGEVIQSMASEAGFDVKIRSMEFASSLQAGYAGDFEAYLIGWSGRADPDGNMWQMLHSSGTFNYGHYQNAEVDKALDGARAVADMDQRKALYHQVWLRERDDLPLIYLWTPANIVGLKASITGFRQVPDGLIRPQGMAMQ